MHSFSFFVIAHHVNINFSFTAWIMWSSSRLRTIFRTRGWEMMWKYYKLHLVNSEMLTTLHDKCKEEKSQQLWWCLQKKTLLWRHMKILTGRDGRSGLRNGLGCVHSAVQLSAVKCLTARSGNWTPPPVEATIETQRLGLQIHNEPFIRKHNLLSIILLSNTVTSPSY